MIFSEHWNGIPFNIYDEDEFEDGAVFKFDSLREEEEYSVEHPPAKEVAVSNVEKDYHEHDQELERGPTAEKEESRNNIELKKIKSLPELQIQKKESIESNKIDFEKTTADGQKNRLTMKQKLEKGFSYYLSHFSSSYIDIQTIKMFPFSPQSAPFCSFFCSIFRW